MAVVIIRVTKEEGWEVVYNATSPYREEAGDRKLD